MFFSTNFNVQEKLNYFNLEKQEKIGEGSCFLIFFTFAIDGCVFKCYDKVQKIQIAIKKIKFSLNDDFGIPYTALREISILQYLNTFNHPNIIKLLDVQYSFRKQKLLLAFEYIENDLKSYIECNKGKLTEFQIKSILKQIFEATSFLHQLRLIHRDLKPSNILIDKQLQTIYNVPIFSGLIKIADFGLARNYQIPIQTLSHEIETLWYRAPEILLGAEEYSTPVDV